MIAGTCSPHVLFHQRRSVPTQKIRHLVSSSGGNSYARYWTSRCFGTCRYSAQSCTDWRKLFSIVSPLVSLDNTSSGINANTQIVSSTNCFMIAQIVVGRIAYEEARKRNTILRVQSRPEVDAVIQAASFGRILHLTACVHLQQLLGISQHYQAVECGLRRLQLCRTHILGAGDQVSELLEVALEGFTFLGALFVLLVTLHRLEVAHDGGYLQTARVVPPAQIYSDAEQQTFRLIVRRELIGHVLAQSFLRDLQILDVFRCCAEVQGSCKAACENLI
uniref:Uncharacterized protein n=1 Tax=Anopheles coluzzii TaxID=1518534 RepID=A0A8W7P7S9_ANOCL